MTVKQECSKRGIESPDDWSWSAASSFKRRAPGRLGAAFLALLLGGVFAARAAERVEVSAAPIKRAGVVRVVDHGLQDDAGPFLGLGVSYFTALWRCRYDRPRLENDLHFLSRQGFNYYRLLSMVGWHSAWSGLEIAPVSFTNRTGQLVAAWPDYWRQLGELIDLGYDRHGLRAQITLFADAQLMPQRAERMEHLRRLLTEVVPGREQKIILIEVANEAWQNGFPGDAGTQELREFTRYLAERTAIPIATTSNHENEFEQVYAHSAADIATWHFSRDRADDGWKPVYDCWDLGARPGFPPVSSNEPIGPGASVASETSDIRLVLAAAFAYVAKLPMYVFHSQAGVFGKTSFEDTPAITKFRDLIQILPADLPAWRRNDGKEQDAPFTVFAGGEPNQYVTERPASRDGCVRNVGSRKEERFVCVPIGIRPEGLQLEARTTLEMDVIHPLTGTIFRSAKMKRDERIILPPGPGGWILLGRDTALSRS